MASNPLTVPDDLEIHETDDGVIVYQESTDRVHHLNNTAAAILELCDGTRSVDAIAEALKELFSLGAPPTTETRACIDKLLGDGLIRWSP